MSNPLVEIWRRKEVACGVWCYLNNDLAIEMAAAQGSDYMLIDLQHGVADISQAIQMTRIAQFYGTNPIIRVPQCDAELIGKSLDGGAAGVMLPMVESAELAAEMVRACRYPPHGIRSFGPVRSALVRGTTDLDELSDVAAIAMIETVKGVEAAYEIARTPGLSAIYIGSVDLSVSLGLGPRMAAEDPRFQEAIETVRKACDAAGIAAGLHCPDGTVAGTYAKAGYRMVTVATDIDLIKAGAKREINSARTLYAGGKS